MSSQGMSSGGSKRSLVIILAVIAIIALVLGVLWLTGSAPSFLNSGSHVKGASARHLFRGLGAIIVAIVLGVGAWWSNKK